MSFTPILAIHGGAWNIPDDLWPAHQTGVQAAHRTGMAILHAGGSALDGITAAIRTLENDPTFDAGIGSFLNEEGDIEMDAGLMEGRQLRSGGVLGVAGIRNPIELARYVLEKSSHCLFSGSGAERLAEQAGLARVADDFHVLARERIIAEKIAAGEDQYLQDAWVSRPYDTVGAMARDHQGDLAAGNSTGGIRHKAVGRVGDAALIGSGFYADNLRGAIICTGWGESIMRSAMAMHALHQLAHLSPQAAAEDAIRHLSERVNGFGGILVMAPDGRCGTAFNTQRMAFALSQSATFQR